MNKKVIYTCLVGNYDDLLQPLVVDDSFDYICFSNDIKEEKIGVWQIRPIPYENKDKARLSRFVKILPHKALGDYDWSLWIDANIQITGSKLYDILDEKVRLGDIIYQVNHCDPPRDCIYDEMRVAYLCGRSDFKNTFLHYIHLRKQHFPTHWGLFENNVIFRKHSDSLVTEISEKWWHEFCHFTKRDQFSLMFVYWKLNYLPSLLFFENESARKVDFLSYFEHKVKTEDYSFCGMLFYYFRRVLSISFDIIACIV